MREDTTGWVKLFHPSGASVSLPIIVDASDEYAKEYPKVAFAAVGAYLEAGFTVNAPGLVAGETREEIGWVLRKEHEKDNELTQVVAVYGTNPALTWKVMHKYINEDADQVAFEKASGLKLTDLPIYPGGDYPERGKAASTDKFIVKVPRPFFVVWKDNPKHVPPPPDGQKDTRTATQKMTKVFVRWESAQGSSSAAPSTNGKPKAQDDESAKIDAEVKWWQQFLAKDPSLQEVTDNFVKLVLPKPPAYRAAIRDLAFDPWKAQTGAWWDQDAKSWKQAKPADDEVIF